MLAQHTKLALLNSFNLIDQDMVEQTANFQGSIELVNLPQDSQFKSNFSLSNFMMHLRCKNLSALGDTKQRCY